MGSKSRSAKPKRFLSVYKPLDISSKIVYVVICLTHGELWTVFVAYFVQYDRSMSESETASKTKDLFCIVQVSTS